MTDKKEAWEQPIYDENSTEDASVSRAEKRTKKKGDSAFITILVLLLLAIAALLVFMFNQGKKPLNDKSSTVEITETTASKEEIAAKEAKEKAAKEKAAKEKAAKEKAAAENADDTATTEATLTDEQTSDTDLDGTPTTETEASDKAETPGESTHVVQQGETPYNIATTNGLSVDELIALNPELADPTGLQIGQVIKLK